MYPKMYPKMYPSLLKGSFFGFFSDTMYPKMYPKNVSGLIKEGPKKPVPLFGRILGYLRLGRSFFYGKA